MDKLSEALKRLQDQIDVEKEEKSVFIKNLEESEKSLKEKCEALSVLEEELDRLKSEAQASLEKFTEEVNAKNFQVSML